MSSHAYFTSAIGRILSRGGRTTIPAVHEGKTVKRIRNGVASGTIPGIFRPADVNRALKIDWAGVFLPKHCEGNSGGDTELFVQIRRGVYRLR